MADLRKRVYFMLGQNNNLKNSDIVKHFVQEGFKRRTIYDIIKRYEIGLPAEDLSRSGRPTSFNGKNLKRLKNATVNRVGVSQWKLAKKFGVVQSTIHYNLKKIGLKYYKRQKAPKYTQKQLQQIPKKCRKMRRQITASNTFIIVDGEKYFTFSNDDMPQNVGFYSFDKEHAPDNVKYKTKEKYPKKVLVWLAISAKGTSTPYIGNTKGPAITADLYINKCLSKLRSFIEEHHAGDEYIFWPDLASAHYANETTQWLLEQKIKFVSKQVNPPNVPKARPIEEFWSILADKIYEGGWEATTELQLKRRIYQKIKQIDMKVVQHMMTSIRTKLRKIEDKGPFSIL
jgi:transposase